MAKKASRAPAPKTAPEKRSTETLSPDVKILSDERAKAYKKLVEASLAHYKQKYATRMRQLRAAYETGATGDPSPGIKGSKIRVPVLLPATQAKIAAIYPKNPEIRVKPRRQKFQIEQPGGAPPIEIDGEDAALRVKALVEYDIERLDLEDEMFNVGVDADVIGFGAIECGWDAFEELEENTAQDAEGTAKGTGEDLAKSTVTLEGSDGEDYKQEFDLRYDPKIAEEQAWAEWIAPENVIFPPHIKNISKTPYMTILKPRQTDEVKADRRLTLPEDFSEKAVEFKEESETTDQNNDTPELVGYVQERHLWHRVDRTHTVFIDGITSPVFTEKWPYAAKGYPVKLVQFYRNPRGGLPISPTGLCIPQQGEKNSIRTRMMQHVNIHQSKVLVDSTVSDEEKERYRTAPDGGLVEVEDIRKYLQIQPAPMPKEWLEYDAITDRDIFNISGVNEYQRSGTGGAKFATEAIIMQSNSAVKVDRQKRLMRKLFIEVATYLFELRQQFMTKKVELNITGESGFTYHQIDPDTIQGDYLFSIDIESSAANDKQRDAEIGKMLIQTLPTTLPYVNPNALLDRAFKYLDVPNRHEIVKPTENLEAMRAADYEDQLMSTTGIPIHPDPKEDLAAHVAVHSQAATGIRQLIQAGQVKSPQEGQLMLRALQLIETHMVETVTLMDKTGQLKMQVDAGQPGTPGANGRVRTDVQQPGTGQGAQPDQLRQGSQQANSRKEGSGGAQATKVKNLTGG